MKKLLGYLLIATGCFGLGSLIQGIRIRRLKKKLSAIKDEQESTLMEIEARMKKILATYEQMNLKEREDEAEKYDRLSEEIKTFADGENSDEKQLNAILTKFMDDNGIPRPWGDRDFKEFMRDPNAKLKFN